jgi:hypothetical protein
MTQAEILNRELTGISSIISAARGMVNDGKAVNLQPLEAEMRRLCASIEGMPRPDAQILEPRLLSLIDELDKLFTAIAGKRAALKEQINDLSLRDRAVSAYAAPFAKKFR